MFKYNKQFRPASDVVFSIMFGDSSMFIRLARAVIGEEIELLDVVRTQAELREDAILASIRFDTYAELKKDKGIITLDMERSKYKARLIRRPVFYAARAISTQDVVDMGYEKIKPVNVVFVLTEHEYPYGIQQIGLTDLKTHELYDDLMNVTIVYVKNVISTYAEEQRAKTDDQNDNSYDSTDVRITADMYTFARFFAISSQTEADQFLNDLGTTELGKELIKMYDAAVLNPAYLEELSKSPYFVSRLNEAQLAYEREKAATEAATKAAAKAAAEATLKAEQQTLERDISNLLKNLKLSPEVVADALEVPLVQVNKIAAKQASIN